MTDPIVVEPIVVEPVIDEEAEADVDVPEGDVARPARVRNYECNCNCKFCGYFYQITMFLTNMLNIYLLVVVINQAPLDIGLLVVLFGLMNITILFRKTKYYIPVMIGLFMLRLVLNIIAVALYYQTPVLDVVDLALFRTMLIYNLVMQLLIVLFFILVVVYAQRLGLDGNLTPTTSQDLEQFSTLQTVANYFSSAPEAERSCPICHEVYLEEEHLRQLNCQHLFHQECLDEWLRRDNHCPICKQIVNQAQNLKAENAV